MSMYNHLFHTQKKQWKIAKNANVNDDAVAVGIVDEASSTFVTYN